MEKGEPKMAQREAAITPLEAVSNFLCVFLLFPADKRTTPHSVVGGEDGYTKRIPRNTKDGLRKTTQHGLTSRNETR